MTILGIGIGIAVGVAVLTVGGLIAGGAITGSVVGTKKAIRNKKNKEYEEGIDKVINSLGLDEAMSKLSEEREAELRKKSEDEKIEAESSDVEATKASDVTDFDKMQEELDKMSKKIEEVYSPETKEENNAEELISNP